MHMVVGNVPQVEECTICLDPLQFKCYHGFDDEKVGASYSLFVPDFLQRSLKPKPGFQIVCFGKGNLTKKPG